MKICLRVITLVLAVINSGLALSVPTTEQTIFKNLESTSSGNFPIISEDTAKYFDHLRRRYGIKGLSIALVASPTYTGEDWLNQTISLGEADVNGNKVTDQVSRPSIFQLMIDVIRYRFQFEIVYFGSYSDTGCEWDDLT